MFSVLPIDAAASARFSVERTTPLGSPPTVAVNCTTAALASASVAIGARL